MSKAGSAACSGVRVLPVARMRLAAAWSPARLTDSTTASLPLAEAEGREGAARRIAARDPLVDVVRQPGDHQLEVALVAPEPGERVVGRGLAGEAGGDALAPDRPRSGSIRAGST